MKNKELVCICCCDNCVINKLHTCGQYKCRTRYNQNYYIKNSKKIIAHNKQYDTVNREKVLKRKRNYNKNNSEYRNEQQKIYAMEHVEEISKYIKRYYINNSEEIKKHANSLARKPERRFKTSQTRAKKRKLEWNIKEKEYLKLIQKPCHYCNNEFGTTIDASGTGLDRIDNSKGYIIDNVVSCCSNCNGSRADKLTTDEMKIFIKNLIFFRNSSIDLKTDLFILVKINTVYIKTNLKTKSGRFSKSKSKAKKRKLEWKLSEIEYLNIINNICYYCDNNNGNTLSEKIRTGGLDRLDNDKGYTIDYVVPCCNDCNVIRGEKISPDEMRFAIWSVIYFRKNNI